VRNIAIVILVLASVWWAVENPKTAQKVVDASKSAVTKVVDYFSD
jgi:steroid 5-alpha reductase family enzyme